MEDAGFQVFPKGRAPRLPDKVPSFPVYLFDIDGTLLDSAVDICGAVQHVISATGIPPARSIDFPYLRSFIGLHLNACFSEVFPHFDAGQRENLVAHYRAIYLDRGHTQTHIYPGVVEGLARLGGRKSTATTKGTPTTRAVLEKFGLLPFFDTVQGTDGFPCKPAPDVILTALSSLGAKPGECLMVGDSPADVAAAKAAGVKVAVTTYGYGNRQELEQAGPDYWITDLRELS
ncbi:MAG TPA: HAD-IA family hydrolase [Bryobacteraceae bacterium]|jgi:HAD superfamily hydrolase (TIGR01509 family)